MFSIDLITANIKFFLTLLNTENLVNFLFFSLINLQFSFDYLFLSFNFTNACKKVMKYIFQTSSDYHKENFF